MKKKIGVILILALTLVSLTVLIRNNTVLNETENNNRITRDASVISKSYLLGLSNQMTLPLDDVVPKKPQDNALLNKNPKPLSSHIKKDTDNNGDKSNAIKHTKNVKNIKSDENLNGTKKQNKKHAKKNTHSYSQNDLYVLSHIIYGEAGNKSWDFQVAVGSVVLNRVKSNKFPNTIKGVVFQKGQYAATWDGNYNKTPSERSKKVAKYLLENGSQLPSYIVFQAEFSQGRGVYKKMGNTYFCY